ncbi:ABC transporter substrate-binding protein [Nakamurella aerolata]|uniref:Amino acid ABC transporter substrate-binding protein n=1 Tax=Nakamurella aerolata TaxID=1656892 RepID=A0A849ACX1_9ACTN|nr:ABC transporter substrate-binding protein [Nakamurella aerolata]NNG36330.1 amino acid ABC transporter substrate-binding protein [Nakamurella aerolata]
MSSVPPADRSVPATLTRTTGRRSLRSARTLAVLAAAGLTALAGCGSSDSAGSGGGSDTSAATGQTTGAPAGSDAGSSSGAAGSGAAGSGAAGSGGAALGGDCTPDKLQTTTPGTLTIATSEPVYEPWMVDNDPTNGKGYESAVAYAVAEQLGYPKDKVAWKRVGFDEAVARQQGWDFDINQFSISQDRLKRVDMSSGYYDVTQTVITTKGSPIDGATSVGQLKDAKLGAMIGTTSLTALNDVIAPNSKPSVFKDNAAAAQALKNKQIDGLVVDLPTAFYMTSAQLDNGAIVGQLPGTTSEKEQFGLLLAKNSPITACATKAVDALRANGSLEKFNAEWLSGKDTAPVLTK